MKRLPTKVPGLDDILNGGLFEGGVYILEGPPGVGKTTLANQIAYTLARSTVRTVYVTMLAESHSRMLQHMEGQDFFDRQQVNASVLYMSGYRELEKDGLKGVIDLLRGELVRSGAGFVVVDGLIVERGAVAGDDSVRKFVHELQSLVGAMSCTCLVLTSGTGNALSAEQTMVDGIFTFEDHGFHWRAERRMQVRKFRGSHVIRGSHTFCITNRGMHFFPRLESLPIAAVVLNDQPEIISTGLPTLNAVLQPGGVMSGTASVVIGHSGAGKTTVALAFASGSSLASPGLLMSCTEFEGDLQRIGANLDLAIGEAVDSGALYIEHLGHEDESMDEMGHKILRMVDEYQIRRLAVDGLAGLADTLAFFDRGYRFLGRLLLELKRRGVTSLFTVDPDALAVAAGTPLAEGVVGWFDNAFVFDNSSTQGDKADRRLLFVRKIRGGQAKQTSVDVGLSMLDTNRSPSA